jgi:hypothetical protein
MIQRHDAEFSTFFERCHSLRSRPQSLPDKAQIAVSPPGFAAAFHDSPLYTLSPRSAPRSRSLLLMPQPPLLPLPPCAVISRRHAAATPPLPPCRTPRRAAVYGCRWRRITAPPHQSRRLLPPAAPQRSQ